MYKITLNDLKQDVEIEGLEYALLHKIDVEKIEDDFTRKLAISTKFLLEQLNEHIQNIEPDVEDHDN